MSLFNQNGQIRSAPIMLSLQNRALQYGDALFETIRLVHGQIPLLEYHWERLERGLNFFGYQIPKNWNAAFLQEEILKLTNELITPKDEQHFRVRLQVFRKAGGLYGPTDHRPEFFITAQTLVDPLFAVNNSGLILGLFDQQAITPAPLSNHKTTNSLVYILAANFAKQHAYDECLLLNTKRQPIEGYYSNLFVRQKGTWLSPPLSAGGVAGTLRAYLLDHSKQLNIKAEETTLSLEDIEKAEAIWLTNAIRGIQWVKSYKNTTFEQADIKAVIQRLNILLGEGLKS